MLLAYKVVYPCAIYSRKLRTHTAYTRFVQMYRIYWPIRREKLFEFHTQTHEYTQSQTVVKRSNDMP